MSINLKGAIGFIIAGFILCAFKESIGSSLVLVFALGLFGFIAWSERYSKSEIESLREDMGKIKDDITKINLGRIVR